MVQSFLTTMPPPVAGAATVEAGASAREPYARAFQWMLLARHLDDKLASLYRGGKIIGGVFLGRGQEALSAALGMQLRPGDLFAPLIRDLAGRLAFGESVLDVVRTHLGSVLGPMRGRDGNVHRGRPKAGVLPMISHLGAMVSVVNGALMARRFRGEHGHIGAASIGDGGTSTGSFHEALNQAAVEKLPLVVVVADNQFAYSTPSSRQFACRDLLDRAAGYGVTGHSADGTDLGSCLDAISRAMAFARGGRGPQMVVAKLLRLCGHGEHDDGAYVESRLKRAPAGRDCVRVAESHLVKLDWASAETVKQWRATAVQQVEDAVATAQREPLPDPAKDDWRALSEARFAGTHEA
jgi:pyruvate dehydrogenase E1 component alpha subunit/2-oxoisovalerate dehydrogenase E1 component alpha subunit